MASELMRELIRGIPSRSAPEVEHFSRTFFRGRLGLLYRWTIG
jgi:hypothetical protein